MSCGIYETVQSAFERNHRPYLQDVYADLMKRIDALPKSSVEELLSAINNTSFCLSRNFGAESFIPKYVRERKNKSCTAIR